MSTELKACYNCNSTNDVEITTEKRTVKYKGEKVTYKHEGHYCNKCKRPYDHHPNQTKANQRRLHNAWKKIKAKEEGED